MPEYAWACVASMSWNLPLMAIVVYAIWYTHNPWCLLGLLFYSGVKYKKDVEPDEIN